MPRHAFLIDGSGFIFRAYHALPHSMFRQDGTLVNAVYGFTSMVMKLVEDTDADFIAVVLDRARRTFRNDIYPDYKANRPPPPDDLIPQFALVREATRALNLACIDMDGFEADDLIATYARLAREAGWEVTIVSSDKDLMQLVGEGVVMFDAMKNRTIGPEQVMEKFGVGPDRVVDVQALAGDSSDNVPGVKGIGDDLASQLVAEYGGLDDLIAKLEDVKHLDNELPQKMAAIEEAINKQAGRELKLGSPNDVAILIFTDLKLASTNVENEKKMKISTAELKDLANKGHQIPRDILRWRFLRKVGSSLAKNILEDRKSAEISRRLVTLRDDVPIEVPLEDLAAREPDPEVLTAFLRAQNFKSLLAKVEARFAGFEAPPARPPDRAGYQLVQDAAALKAWIAEALEAGVVAVDTETTSLDSMRAELVGVSLSLADGRACYVPLAHRPPAAQGALDLGDGGGDGGGDGDGGGEGPKQIPLEQALALLKGLFEADSVLKVGQNIKYDIQVLARYGLSLAPVDDTMVLSYVLEGGLHGHGLDELARLHFDLDTIKFKDVVGSGKSQVTFDRVPLEDALAYAAEDADVTGRLHRLLKPRLVAERMVAVYETMERPLIPILERMERHGVRIDAGRLKHLSDDFTIRLGDLEVEIHHLAGRQFNVGSPKQLGEVLFDEMGLPGGKKGKTGAYATGAVVLDELAADGHRLPARVLDWRQLAKLKSTYTDALVGQVNPDTGRVHTSYSMAVTSTGRLASSDPNLQNIPVRTEEGRKIRQAFVAAEGYRLLSADYSQIELRLLAHVAGIEALKEAFRDGLDIHAMTASQVFGVPIEGMDPQVRRQAKAINFGIVYGISAFGLARQLGISRGQAADYIKAYFERYPGINDYMERTKEEARKQGFVTTLFGRRCHVLGIGDRNQARRGFAERAAINAPIQGGAADIIKRAMVRLPETLEKSGLMARMLLQVHDELVFEVPEAEIEETAAVVAGVMESAARLDVPLVVDTGFGDNWDQAH